MTALASGGDGTAEPRFIVPSCCEDFLLHENQGLFAPSGAEFECFACRRLWRKTAPAQWQCISDRVDYDVIAQAGDLGAQFYYLKPRANQQPLTRRCCQNVIRYADPKIWTFIQSSPRWSIEGLVLSCLVCDTKWRPRLVEVLGWQKLCYEDAAPGLSLVLQDLPSGQVLVPLSEWSP